MTRLTLLVLLIACAAIYAEAATVWTPQIGYYQKQLSPSGKARYVLTTPPVATVTPDPCLTSAKFKCEADWGVVFNLDESIAGQCTRLSVKKTDLSDASIYSGMKVVNGVAVCP